MTSQIAEVDSRGDVVALREPKRLPPDSTCGQIAVSGAGAVTRDLTTGIEPEVVILCDNQQRPDRYPKPRRYLFEAVTKTSVAGNTAPRVLTCRYRDCLTSRAPAAFAVELCLDDCSIR